LTDAHALQERVQEAAAYMRARLLGGLFVVCLDNLAGSAKIFLPTSVAPEAPQTNYVQVLLSKLVTFRAATCLATLRN
jgi:hypothetical protein